MADEPRDTAAGSEEGGNGWRIREPARRVPLDDWQTPPDAGAPRVPEPVSAPPVAPPSPTTSRPRSRAGLVFLAAGLLVAGGAAAGVYALGSHPSTQTVNAAVASSSALAVVRAGPPVIAETSLSTGAQVSSLTLTGSTDDVVTNRSHTMAYLLDSDHGTVTPFDLVHGSLGTPISVGRLPIAESLSSDGSSLFVTDNLDQSIVRIDTATERVINVQNVAQGVGFFVLSPTFAQAIVGFRTPEGQPGLVVFVDLKSGRGTPVQIGKNTPGGAIYSADGATAWVLEDSKGSQPAVAIPIDVATRRPGTALVLGHGLGGYDVTPDGRLAVIANGLDGTVSIIDLGTKKVMETVTVCAGPNDVEITPDGSTAWVACALTHVLVPVTLDSATVGRAVPLGNAPAALMLPPTAGSAWVIYPSSPGNVAFLQGSRVGHAIPVGNAPDMVISRDGRTGWVENSLTNTVQRVDVSSNTASTPIGVGQTPNGLALTPDGRRLLVLGFGDAVHAGTLTSIDTTTSKPSAPLQINAAPSSLVISPDGSRAYAANSQANAVTVVDVPHWRVLAPIALPCSAASLAVAASVEMLYADCVSTAQLIPIRLSDSKLLKPIAVGPDGRLVVGEHGTVLFVLGADSLQRIDTAKNAVVATQTETGNLATAALTPDSQNLLAVDNSGAALLRIDPLTLRTASSITLGGRPGELLVSSDGSHAYVLDTSAQKLFVVDVNQWKISATVNVGANALSAAEPITTP